MSEYQNDADQDRSLYTKFTEDLSTQGNMKWQFHDEQTDICMMNDVDKETGVMKPNSFIHVTYTTDKTGEIMLTCTCKIFDFIHQTAHQHNPSWPLEETIPHTSFTCPHCRYFKEHLINAYTEVLTQPIETLPPSLCMVKRSLQFINEPYVLMGNVHSSSTTKFSVKGIQDNTYASVCHVRLHPTDY